MYCIITGGTKGIGRATAEIFAANGFHIALVARSVADLQTTKAMLEERFSGVEVLIFSADLTDAAAVKQTGAAILAQWPQIDVLVNNAGTFLPGTLLDEAEGTLEHMMQLNLYSSYHLTRAVAPAMVQRGRGHIFNIGSVASLTGMERAGSYVTTKFAMLGFTRSLRLELRAHGVKVTAVLPGSTLTNSWDGVEVPEGRLIDPQEVAQAIWNAWQTGPTVCIEEILLRPQLGDY